MLSIETDMPLGCLSQLLGISAVLHDPKVLVGAAGIVAGPANNCLVVSEHLQRWTFGDPHLCRLFGGWLYILRHIFRIVGRGLRDRRSQYQQTYQEKKNL